MSTKTIAVEIRVYEKLARKKLDGESFTQTIHRLVEADSGGETCEAAVRQAAAIWSTPPGLTEVEVMEQVIQSNRKQVNWSVESLS